MNNIINMFKKTWKYLLLALAVVVAMRYYIAPEFFDMFGVIIFGGLILIGLYGLYSNKKLHNWILFSLIVVGIFGLIVDSATSFTIIKSWIFG